MQLCSVIYSSYPNNFNQNSGISFGHLKKSELSNSGYVVSEKFKPPLEQFSSTSDLEKWAKKEYEIKKNKKYLGKTFQTTKERKEILSSWIEFLDNNYSYDQKLLIFDGITKDLKQNNETLPPILDKCIVDDVIVRLDYKREPQFNFLKSYKSKVLEKELNTKNTGWIEIPSLVNDLIHFRKNKEKLQLLSYKDWCTKTHKAGAYLSKGNFHIYYDNGEPSIGIRFIGNTIEEIQGKSNNNLIPLKYYPTIVSHIDDLKTRKSKNKITEFFSLKPKLAKKPKEALNQVGELYDKINKYKSLYSAEIQRNNPEELLPIFGIEVEKDIDGKLIISHYTSKIEDGIYFTTLGIDENKLFKNVKKVKGDANFYNSSITKFYDLEEIGGDASFFMSNIVNTGKLRKIGGNASFSYSKIKTTGDIEYIGGYANCERSKINKLKKLKYIGGNAVFNKCEIEDLGPLETVLGNLDISGTKLKSTETIKKISGKIIKSIHVVK